MRFLRIDWLSWWLSTCEAIEREFRREKKNVFKNENFHISNLWPITMQVNLRLARISSWNMGAGIFKPEMITHIYY